MTTRHPPDPPEIGHLNVKKIAKNLTFFKKIAKNGFCFEKKWTFFCNFFEKKSQVLGNFRHSNVNFPDGQVLTCRVERGLC